MTKRPSNSNGKPPTATPSVRPIRKARLGTAAALAARGKPSQLPVLITGGAGFIGTNLAHRLLSSGQSVLLLDNLSRPGVEQNLAWLRQTHGDQVQIQIADVQDFPRLRKAVRGVSKVFHFAAQVAVTTSLQTPFVDFEVNARGTLNVLEALRELADPPPLLFTSTNKVYGNLNDVTLRADGPRYQPAEAEVREAGFNESRPLDFHSPYGCSKGAAEQYVLDYARTFGLRAVVFRMSCIYGPHQFGNEDQGWVAHFLIRAMEGSPITVYGDGKQVRDILFVEDLVRAFLLALDHIDQVSGQAFNIGGGARHTISLLELVEIITELEGRSPSIRFDEWRPADQQYYVSDIRKFKATTGWSPQVDVRQGIQRLYHWLRQSRKAPLVAVVVPEAHPAKPLNGLRVLEEQTEIPASQRPFTSREPRSKRLWRLRRPEPEALSRKIIKFP